MAGKEYLFERFSKNWQMVRPTFKDVDSKVDGFYDAVMCPLCMHLLKRQALYMKDHDKQLTGEHLPPDSLGGTVRVLLCKKCNNKTGETIDKKLLEFLEVKPFREKEIGSSIEVIGVLKSGDVEQVKSRVTFQRIGEKAFHLKFNIEDQYRKERLEKIDPVNYSIKITAKPTPRHLVQIALLKIAYLFAFEKFGHSLILAGEYANIREQILNPEKKILPCYGVMKTDVIPLSPGIYHIRQPIDLKGLLVVFELEHNGKIDKNAVLLPPPYLNDKLYYWEVFKYEGKDITFRDYRKFKDVDFLNNPIAEYLHSAIFEHLKPYEFEIESLGF